MKDEEIKEIIKDAVNSNITKLYNSLFKIIDESITDIKKMQSYVCVTMDMKEKIIIEKLRNERRKRLNKYLKSRKERVKSSIRAVV